MTVERNAKKSRTKRSPHSSMWVKLPRAIVEARAGLIPSHETDRTPPPPDLTVREIFQWHRGAPILTKRLGK
jgi:hypothetical protein